MRRTSVALVLLTVICPVLLFLSASAIANRWLAAPLICLLPILLVVIAAGDRQPRIPGLLMVWTVLAASWLSLLWLSRTHDLALPSAIEALVVVGIMLFGLGLLPLVVVGWLFQRWYGQVSERQGRGQAS